MGYLAEEGCDARGQNSTAVRLTVESVQWLVSSLENRAASFTNTAAAFRINVMKS